MFLSLPQFIRSGVVCILRIDWMSSTYRLIPAAAAMVLCSRVISNIVAIPATPLPGGDTWAKQSCQTVSHDEDEWWWCVVVGGGSGDGGGGDGDGDGDNDDDDEEEEERRRRRRRGGGEGMTRRRRMIKVMMITMTTTVN